VLEPDTAHKVTAEARDTAVKWLARWLKPWPRDSRRFG